MAIVARSGEPATSDTARLIEAEAGRLYDAMHGLIPRLMPVTLDTLGLADTLENLVRDWQRRYPAVVLSLRHQLPADLGPSVTLVAYRVAQEGLINALRHAQPKHVEIELAAAQDGITLVVRDDGAGLPADWARPGHFGLRGLIDRVERLGGTLFVGREPPRGTLLRACLPLAGTAATQAASLVRAGNP
jgi:two-component system, NarL family, sensor histidine kinase UhpB